MPSDTRVIQVSNVAPSATRDQMKTLFNYIGKINDIVLYPESEPNSTSTRVCYVKFDDYEDVGVALHLTNTVFIDRALIIVPVPDGRIPDEKTALEGAQNGLSLYPALPSSTELSKVDEIRRTVYVSNIDPSMTPETLMQFFGANAGEVKYARMAGDANLIARSAFVEFTEQVSVMRALGLSGQVLGSHAIAVVPANTAIAKSSSSSHITTNSREIEEAMRKVNEAQPLIDAVLEEERRRSSRSRSKRSRSRHSRSRSHSRRRSKSKRSRSRRRSRSRSHRSRRRSVSRSPRRRSPRHRRSGSRSVDRRHSSRRSPSYRSKRDISPPVPDERDSRRSYRDETAPHPRRSRTPSSRGSRRDRDQDVDRGRPRERDRESGDKRGRGSDEKGSRREHKSSRRHHDKEKKSRRKSGEEDDEQGQEYEEDGSEFEQQGEDHTESDDGRDFNGGARDMDVDSD